MGRGKRDRVAELFESANMMTLNASCIELVKVVSSEIRVRFLLPQDMVNDHQQTVGDGDNGLLSPSSSRNAMVLGRQIIDLHAGDDPGHFSQHRSQLSVFRARCATKPLATALFVPQAVGWPADEVVLQLLFRLAPADGADRTVDCDDEPTAYPIPTSKFPQW